MRRSLCWTLPGTIDFRRHAPLRGGNPDRHKKRSPGVVGWSGETERLPAGASVGEITGVPPWVDARSLLRGSPDGTPHEGGSQGPDVDEKNRSLSPGGCTTRLWQSRFWTHGWHAQAQLERVFLGHRSQRNDHGQTKSDRATPLLPLFIVHPHMGDCDIRAAAVRS